MYAYARRHQTLSMFLQFALQFALQPLHLRAESIFGAQAGRAPEMSSVFVRPGASVWIWQLRFPESDTCIGYSDEILRRMFHLQPRFVLGCWRVW